ncbi:MAG: hypothetical protein H7835_12860 [Magnetococcus sp. XQGC-1]
MLLGKLNLRLGMVAEDLRLAIGEAQRRFTRHINFRMKWRGHLWQERFASFPIDEAHLYTD